jgi:hypothetical protein
MRTLLPTRQLGTSDLHITRLGFGAWAILTDDFSATRVAGMAADDWRLRSADQISGWIDAATLILTNTDLDEIAAAIARTGAGHGPPIPTALAA